MHDYQVKVFFHNFLLLLVQIHDSEYSVIATRPRLYLRYCGLQEFTNFFQNIELKLKRNVLIAHRLEQVLQT
jgi:hypothetical protein